jgi:glycosyltransferase involved in cell wall biosynthesis
MLEENHESVCVLSRKGKLRVLIRAIRYSLKHGVKFIIIHGFDYFIYAAVLKLITGRRVIIQHHAEKMYLRKKAILLPLCDRLMDGYFFNGLGSARPFYDRKQITKRKIFEVTEGTCDFVFADRSVVNTIRKIVFIGRLNTNKNLETVLKALSIVVEYRQDFSLEVYYMDGEQENELKRFVKLNNLSDFVLFKGFIPNLEINKALNDADIFISASFYEGSGYALIEAMACGCYPVVSRIPSYQYLLDGLEEKQLFDPNNTEELSQSLLDAMGRHFDTTIRLSIRKQFEQRASAEAIARQIEVAINNLPA